MQGNRYESLSVTLSFLISGIRSHKADVVRRAGRNEDNVKSW